MVGEMPVAPHRLGEAQQQAQAQRKRGVPPRVPEEGTVDEVVGDGLCVPPEPESHHQQGRPKEQHHPVRQHQAHEQSVLAPVPEHAALLELGREYLGHAMRF